jgi:hypothetical protein
MFAVDYPKEVEYSLEAGDHIQSFSNAKQDVKLITQVLENITNGFFLDSNAGDGEERSNTLLLELTGWRGLLMEPRSYWYAQLWGKMRKSWLFLGTLSPDDQGRKVGFDYEGNVDELSGHRIHTYPLKRFMTEMGGRKTIDFWNLNIGGYEFEALNETLLGSGSGFEFGCIMVTFEGRISGRGNDPWVTMRTKDETEDLVFEALHNASYSYLGGLDAYWVNHVSPRWHYKDHVWINPAYFEKRGIPTPKSLKSAPPPPFRWPRGPEGNLTGNLTWDEGYTDDEEIAKMVAYIKKSKEAAMAAEPVAKAHRVKDNRLYQASGYPGYAKERDYAMR